MPTRKISVRDLKRLHENAIPHILLQRRLTSSWQIHIYPIERWECCFWIICLLQAWFISYQLPPCDQTTAYTECMDQTKEAWNTFNADVVGRMDYAAEYIGGYIYAVGTNLASDPSKIIDKDVQPGNCFAFVGSKGSIQVVLRDSIVVRSITLSHASKYLLEEEDLTVPKEFEVYGYRGVEDGEGVFLGRFTYERFGEQHQQFFVHEYQDVQIKKVGIVVLSYYGGEYTCVYRLRVHEV